MPKRLFSYFSLSLAGLLLGFPLLAIAGRDVEQILREEGERARQNAGLYYDEVFDQNGELRPQYRDIYPALLKKSKAELEKIRRLTKQDFRNDNALSAFALITDEAEHERKRKRKGVEQRGRALLEFLKDHYSGKKTYSSVISPELVDRIIERTGESGYAGLIDPERIAFMYGPDMIRGYDGKFYVLEDNTNYLGGQGDLVEARRSLWKRVPEYSRVLAGEALADPMDFYRRLLARYRAQMPDPQQKIIFFAAPPFPDQEDGRLIKIWRSLGVEYVSPYTRNPKLVRRADGMYLERRRGKVIRREKVGFMIMNSEFAGLDPSVPAAHEQFLREQARAFLEAKGKEKISKSARAALEQALIPDPRTGRLDLGALEKALREKVHLRRITVGSVPGLVDAVLKGLVLANNTPGVDFINDKEFNIYVEDLIRHYRKEEPILLNLPARKIYRLDAKGRRVPDEEVFRDMAEHRERYVLKIVDGRGGDGVAVGAKESPERWAELLQERRRDTSHEAIAQEYRHPSVAAGNIIDERLLSQVGAHPVGGTYLEVSPVGWSRGVSMFGDGKVNLSQGKAHELTVIQRRIENGHPLKRANCPDLFRSLPSVSR